MAQPVVTKIRIGSTDIVEFTDLTISQSLFDHHHFSLGIPFDRLEGTTGSFLSKAHKQLCGQRITVSIAGQPGPAGGELKFQGIVTQLEVAPQSDLTGSFRVQGYGPTYLLDQTPMRRTFRQQTLLAIFQEVLKPYTDGLLPLLAKPRFTAPIPYVAQYDESAFAFLHRLAAQYGEWFYYDGTRLHLGRPTGTALALVSDGVRAGMSLTLSLRHSAFVVSQYGLAQHQTLRAASDAQDVAWLSENALTEFAMSESERLFPQVMQLPPPMAVADQPGLDAVAARYKSQHATSLVSSSGWGESPAVHLGTVLETSGKALGTEATNQESFGKYLVTAVTHTVAASEMYSHLFEAVPWSAEYPPLGPPRKAPGGQPELAEVVDLDDPLGLGRVRVRYYWPVDKPAHAESDWLRVSTPYSGNGKGQLFTPEKGSQVLVGYEHNRAEQPLILGNLFHPHNPQATKYTTAQNQLKGLQTAGGNKFVMSDAAGAQTILISNSNNKGTAISVSFKGDGSIDIQTNGPINLTAGQDITLQAGKSISLVANENISLVAKKRIGLEALNEDIALRAQKELLLTAVGGDLTLEAVAKKTVVKAAGDAEMTAAGIVKLNGQDVKLNG